MVCDLTAAPHLTEKPQDVQKIIDDTLVWECKASAKPKPSYRWLKNGEPLDPMEVRDFFNIAFNDKNKEMNTDTRMIAQFPAPYSTDPLQKYNRDGKKLIKNRIILKAGEDETRCSHTSVIR